MSAAEAIVRHVTCLGCGCACDDIDLSLQDGRIVAARQACSLGASWFGDGRVPGRTLVGGRESSLDEALDAIVALLVGSKRPLVYLAPDLSCETQREIVRLADLLRSAIDSVTSATAADSLLAAQERGRATATLGEIRNRADLVVWWGVDPAVSYPRYMERYVPAPAGVHVPGGRRSRTVVAVDIGDARGPADADRRVEVLPDDELDTLTALRRFVESGNAVGGARPFELAAGELGAMLQSAKYAAIVADAEPAARPQDRDPHRAGALIALAQTLNASSRCALALLRAGGNRSGADAVLTWQTGYPMAVDFFRGHPTYRPYDGSAEARLARGDVDAVLVVGSPALVPPHLAKLMMRVGVAVAGPRASESVFARSVAIVDTGVAGIHEGGTAVRMDDVPVRLGAPLAGPTLTLSIARALGERIVTRQRNAEQGQGAPVLR